MGNYFNEYEVTDRHSASIAYQHGFDDAMRESGAFTYEIYFYMLFFIVVFAASHMIPSRGRINDHFV